MICRFSFFIAIILILIKIKTSFFVLLNSPVSKKKAPDPIEKVSWFGKNGVGNYPHYDLCLRYSLIMTFNYSIITTTIYYYLQVRYLQVRYPIKKKKGKKN
jgi:hypothetical protein